MTKIEETVAAAIAAANEQRTDGYSDAFKAALNAIAHLPKQDWTQARDQLAEALPRVDAPIGAGLIAVWFGSAVEDGVDPELTAQSVATTMLRWMGQLKTPAEDDEGPEPEANGELLTGLQYLGQGLVAHVARSSRIRDHLRSTGPLFDELERVEHLSIGAHWVFTLFKQVSGELIVLHGVEPVGVRVRYENLQNCFHLFTLLQAALANTMPGAKNTIDEVVAVANGRAYKSVHDTAWWHFGQGDDPEGSIGASIWGEGSPASIVKIDGHQVMLLWAPVLGSRSWGSSFFAPFIQAAPPSVTVEELLDPEAVASWRSRLKLDVR